MRMVTRQKELDLFVLFILTVSIFFTLNTYLYVSSHIKQESKAETWKELLQSWDNDFLTIPAMNSSLKTTYPDEVKFLINEAQACKEPVLVIALVITAIENRRKRHFIRRTWGHEALVEKTGIKHLFIVGQTNDHQKQSKLLEESSSFHDVIQANFIDAYDNLTYKTISLLRWTTEFCVNAPILLKIDDDVLLNPIALNEFLVAYLKRTPRPIHIMGKLRCCDPVLRDGRNKVSQAEYQGEGYPPYVAGPSYIVPTAIIPALLQAIKRTRFLKLEDVFTTGLAAKTGRIKHKNILSLTNSNGNKIKVKWSSGATVFQENVGMKAAARGWNALRKLENITVPEEYVLPDDDK